MILWLLQIIIDATLKLTNFKKYAKILKQYKWGDFFNGTGISFGKCI